MPACNAEKTLRRTWDELPHDLVDEVVLVDDVSSDSTVTMAREPGIRTILHRENMGYGAHRKTCYREALKLGGGPFFYSSGKVDRGNNSARRGGGNFRRG
jgi:glycosyltransferase involved in cell wall biosynthesis